MRQLLGPSGVVLALLFSLPSAAIAARVRGSLNVPAPTYATQRLGYTRTSVALPSPLLARKRASVALFLKVKTSLPIAEPERPSEIRIAGFDFEPAVAACAVDGKVNFVNDGSEPATLLVAGAELGTLSPGESKIYGCVAGNPGEDPRPVRVKQWTHVRGLVYVGEVGVVGAPDPQGAFVLEAPKGEYELHVVGVDGLLTKRDVVVERGDVALGTIDLAPSGQRASEGG